MQNNIAIIPARGGSKRIPKKNIREFCGKPVIAYSIEAALSSNLFDEVMVSTEDKTIADIAIQYGAKVPFMRSIKNADDYSTTFDVLKEVIDAYQQSGFTFQHACCIYATAPFVKKSALQAAYQKLTDQKFYSVFPVARYTYPMWRSLKLDNDKVSMWWPENLNKRSQDLPESYHDVGQFYWFNIQEILKAKTLYTQNSGALIVSELEVQDIDTSEDWHMAELKYKFLQQR